MESVRLFWSINFKSIKIKTKINIICYVQMQFYAVFFVNDFTAILQLFEIILEKRYDKKDFSYTIYNY